MQIAVYILEGEGEEDETYSSLFLHISSRNWRCAEICLVNQLNIEARVYHKSSKQFGTQVECRRPYIIRGSVQEEEFNEYKHLHFRLTVYVSSEIGSPLPRPSLA